MTDPIADLITRIRNAQVAKHDVTSAPYSKMKEGVLRVMAAEGFILGFEVQEVEGLKNLKIKLRYDEKKRPVLNEVTRISKPGRRVYLGYQDIKPIRDGMGLAILSTPQGVISDKDAREKKVGGEVLCRLI